MQRDPAVANQFYPGEAKSLRRMLEGLIPNISDKQDALAVVSPHAGYIYSGAVAGETLAKVNIPADIIILGPNHHGYGKAVALMDQGSWMMPLGEVDINETLAALLLKHSATIKEDTLAHRFEHSLEVQVPFLQYLRQDFTITPLVISYLSYETCREVGISLAKAIKEYGKPVLMVASSDMSHYESRASATAKDNLAIDRIKAFDPEGLYKTVKDKGITMCGVMPATIAMIAAQELGASKAELVRYTDSGEASGDISQVVGYAGIIIS
ncbi:MAG: AmmeMemoRadiSam system protein B [Desulfobulbaceae bacterium]|nr:AmmeMemoRadiSam system protein B [Desulfobulbaceae bacterium]HIJ78825.1 AmmeMemoRadiSam system protein B [Deltaproteobacteria bacterium]